MAVYHLLYHPAITTEDLPKIDLRQRKIIQNAIEERLSQDPFLYGAPLRKTLKGYRKLRVGDYRVIYEVVETQIRIYKIGHRKEVYEQSLKDWKNQETESPIKKSAPLSSLRRLSGKVPFKKSYSYKKMRSIK